MKLSMSCLFIMIVCLDLSKQLMTKGKGGMSECGDMIVFASMMNTLLLFNTSSSLPFSFYAFSFSLLYSLSFLIVCNG